MILGILLDEPAEGRLYSAVHLAEKFENTVRLGSKHTIRGRLSVPATKGFAKFRRDGTSVDITLVELAGFLQREHGDRFASSTIWHLLDRRALTFKKTAHGLAEGPETECHFASVSDLMVGILFVFLLMLTVFALNFRDDRARLDEQNARAERAELAQIEKANAEAARQEAER